MNDMKVVHARPSMELIPEVEASSSLDHGREGWDWSQVTGGVPAAPFSWICTNSYNDSTQLTEEHQNSSRAWTAGHCLELENRVSKGHQPPSGLSVSQCVGPGPASLSILQQQAKSLARPCPSPMPLSDNKKLSKDNRHLGKLDQSCPRER